MRAVVENDVRPADLIERLAEEGGVRGISDENLVYEGLLIERSAGRIDVNAVDARCCAEVVTRRF